MLRFVRGGSQRSIVSAAVAVATAALTVSGCTASSSGGHQSPSPHPSPSTTSASPDTIGQDATTELQGSATITLGSSAPVSVATARSQPVTLELSPSGTASVEIAMRNRAGDLFSLSGPAHAGGSVATDDISVLLLNAGAIVDTQSGNPCTASYDVVSETAVRGTVRCQTLSGQQKVPVIVRFSAS